MKEVCYKNPKRQTTDYLRFNQMLFSKIDTFLSKKKKEKKNFLPISCWQSETQAWDEVCDLKMPSYTEKQHKTLTITLFRLHLVIVLNVST